jgi:1,2-diacylglycerol 3-beta-galactosyltransferase
MGTKKRVLVLYADAGFGHRSAAKAIAAALEETCGADCEVSLANPLDDDRTPTWLREVQSDYDRVARELPRLYKMSYDATDTALARRLAENALRILLFRSIKALLERVRPDAIVSTYPLYQAPLSAVYAIERRFVPTICVVTDLTAVHQLWFSHDADLTVVPTPTVRDLARGAGIKPERIEEIGIPVHPRLSTGIADKAERRRSLGWREGLTTVLAVGSKRVGKLESFLNVLNHSGLPLQLAIVAGGDERLFSSLEATEWHLPVKLYDYVADMPAMMRAADCMASKAGGLIVSESLAVGLPLLIIEAIPGQESGNADYVVRGGAGDIAVDPLRALETMRHWLLDDGALLRERAAKAKELGRPKAAYSIAERAAAFARRGPVRREIAQLPGLSKLRDLLRRHGVSTDD